MKFIPMTQLCLKQCDMGFSSDSCSTTLLVFRATNALQYGLPRNHC